MSGGLRKKINRQARVDANAKEKGKKQRGKSDFLLSTSMLVCLRPPGSGSCRVGPAYTVAMGFIKTVYRLFYLIPTALYLRF